MGLTVATPPEPQKLQIEFPDAFEFLFRPSRYKVGYGGRGSGKSWSFARALILCAVLSPERILCCRELQTSIAESVHRLLAEQIDKMGFNSIFDIQQQGIYRFPYETELEDTERPCGSEFFFYGIKNNTNKVKSTEGITKCWVEEAEKVSEDSWRILIPTIRVPGSEIWISFNPDEENDPTYQRFVLNPPPNCKPVFINWDANPWFGATEMVSEKDHNYRVDPDSAAHVWGGQCRKNSSSQIFRGKYIVEAFTTPDPARCDSEHPMWDGPYFGADWGFAQDPTVLIKSWINHGTRKNPCLKLMIEAEAYGVGIELDDIPTMFKRVPGVASRLIRADSSRPETISHVGGKPYCENLNCNFTFNTKYMEPKCPRCGGKPRTLQIEAAEKWDGSIEDGVDYLRNFDQIVIHPNCKHFEQEARLYSYKVDRLTKEVLAEILDKWNHCWDATRYAHQPMIMSGTSLGVWIACGR